MSKKFHAKSMDAKRIDAQDVPKWLSAWIDKSGKIYWVRQGGHALAAYLLGSSTDDLEQDGWVHLTFGEVLMQRWPNEAQLKSLHDIKIWALPKATFASGLALTRSAAQLGF